MKWFIKALSQYADFSERARRKEYWMFALFNIIFFFAWAIIFMIAFSLTQHSDPDRLLSTIYITYLSYFIILFLPGLAVSVRRLHDVGKSGWWLFISLIPFIGAIWLFILLLTDGQQGDNKYGANPKTSSEVFSDRSRLKSIGVTLIIVFSITLILAIIYNWIIPFFRYGAGIFSQYSFLIREILNLAAIIILLKAGFDLLNGKTINIEEKKKNAINLIRISVFTFFILSTWSFVNSLLHSNAYIWMLTSLIRILLYLSVVLFANSILSSTQNKDFTHNIKLAVIILSVLCIIADVYSNMLNMSHSAFQSQYLFLLFYILIPVAYIVFLGIPFPKEKKEEKVFQPATYNTTKQTFAKENIPTKETPKSTGTDKRFTISNLEKVRVNTSASDIITMFGQPDFKMAAEEVFARMGFVPASQRGIVYWTYNTAYGSLQLAVKDNSYLVNSNGLESIIEKVKAASPAEKMDIADKKIILNEKVRFSIASFKPDIDVPGFTKEDAYKILDNFLINHKPQKMSEDETELLKPFFMNLLMNFRNEAYLYSISGRGFGGICDSCNTSIDKNSFYLMGSWGKCQDCTLQSIVCNLDWNYYLSHVVQGLGQVPNTIISQGYDIIDKINKRRAAAS